MNIDTILRLLKNSGFHVLGVDSAFIRLEDPSCILRSFETFLDYAWIAITAITFLLLFGWAISYIRGSKIDSLFLNLRNLTLIFGILAAVRPIVSLIWGGDVFARGCKTINVSVVEVQKILDARNQKLATYNADDLYEEFDIYDSGALTGLEMPHEIPYSAAPLPSAGEPQNIPVTLSGGGDFSTGAFPVASVARSSKSDVVYTDADGKTFRKTGGSRAWRNNNPGNIRYSKFAQRNGAIGEAGGFAVFPDEATGMAAISALLRSDSYNKLTIEGAISRYAPPVENNTAAYHKRLQQLTGLPISTRMSQLNDAQLQRVATAIRQIEGWKPGREVRG